MFVDWIRAIIAAITRSPGSVSAIRDQLKEAESAWEREDFAAAASIYTRLSGSGVDVATHNLAVLQARGHVPGGDQGAIRLYRKSANRGFALSQSELAHRYLHGVGLMPHDRKAAMWARLAAEKGDARGLYHYGYILFHGIGTKRDRVAGLAYLERADKAGWHEVALFFESRIRLSDTDAGDDHWFRRLNESARHGSGLAHLALGRLHAEGIGVTVDRKTAAEHFRTAIKLGRPEAWQNLGELHESGINGEADIAMARECHREMIENDLPDGHYHLGRLAEGGTGEPPDSQKANQLYQRGCDQGSGAAYHAAGRQSEACGLLDEALVFYERGAELHDCDAMCAAGRMYREGRNGHPDRSRAFRRLLPAARRGHIESIYQLGLLIDEGEAASVRHARREYRVAADAGHPHAQYRLARLLLEGRGGSSDLPEACLLLHQARTGGDASLEREVDSTLSYVYRDMSAEERERAAGLLTEHGFPLPEALSYPAATAASRA